MEETTPGATPSPSPNVTPEVATSPGDKAKKLATLILGVVILLWTLLVGVGFTMVGEGGKGTQLPGFLGATPRDAIGSFSMFTYGLFALVGLILLALFLISLIQMARTPKEDLTRKSKTMKTVASGVGLFLILIGWLIVVMILSARAETFAAVAKLPPIATEPKNTLGLSAPVTIQFDATGFAGKINVQKYTILSYVWDFGDGTTATGPKVSHEYVDKGKSAGVFNATLEVTMQDRSSGAQIINKDYKTTISIKNIKPTIILQASSEKGAAPLAVNFDASSSTDPDGKITGFAWDLDGNGVFNDATGEKASYTYTASGTYEAAVQVTDNSGDTNVLKKPINISSTFALKSAIDVNSEVNGKLFIGKSYLFDGKRSSSPSGKVTKYTWNFGDGTPAQSGRSVSHAFKTMGTYEVLLTVTDEGGTSATAGKKVSVTEPAKTPISLITSSPAAVNGKITGAAPLSVNFDATKSTDTDDDIVEYAWDFDSDGTFDKFGPSASYVYPAQATYTAILRVTDSDNSERTAQVTVEVGAPGINAKINATPVTGVVPLTVKFDASASTYLENQIISYEWDFGDGSPKRQDAAKISYKYNKVGTYTAKVTAIGSDGKKATTGITITVQNVPVKACFNSNRKEAKVPAEFVFNANCSTGSIAKFNWDLDNNGNFSDAAGMQVSKTFTDLGIYTISLEVTDGQGVVDVFTDTFMVTE